MLTGLLATTVDAVTKDASHVKAKEGQALKAEQGRKSGQFTRIEAGTSLDARYKKRVAVKKRAAEMRKRLIRESQNQKAK
jgi:hypothetical protein